MYLWISENGITGILTGTFWWNKFTKLGYINLSNRCPEIITYGHKKNLGFVDRLTRVEGGSAGSVSASESVTTLLSSKMFDVLELNNWTMQLLICIILGLCETDQHCSRFMDRCMPEAFNKVLHV